MRLDLLNPGARRFRLPALTVMPSHKRRTSQKRRDAARATVFLLLMLAAALAGLGVTEYAANRVKQAVTGYGHAEKSQIQAMIGVLLPGSGKLAADAADALAVAICHAHHDGPKALKVRLQ